MGDISLTGRKEGRHFSIGERMGDTFLLEKGWVTLLYWRKDG